MRIVSTLLVAACLLFSSLQSVAASQSPVGNWRLSTKTTVKVFPPSGKAVTGTASKGVEFATFSSDLKYLSSEWIDRLNLYFVDDVDGAYLVRIDLAGQWSITSTAYTVTYDTAALSLRTKRGKNVIAAFLSRTGYLDLLGQKLTYTPMIDLAQVVAYSDSGKLTNNGKGLSGTKKTIFLVVWNDPVTSSRLQSEIHVTVTYKGTRITTTSSCCANVAPIPATATADEKAAIEAANAAIAAANATASETFLAATAAMPDVQTTSSGLQYIVLQTGNVNGSHPASTDKVTVNYRGMYPSGTIFDSASLATFSLSGVIAGWTEGLQLMKPGDKYRFFIPSSLAYGAAGNSSIGPNSALVFDVELADITQP